MKKAKYSRGVEMANSTNLSLVAMFDDIARNESVLSAGIESEFMTYVNGMEEMRKRLLQMESKAVLLQEANKSFEAEKKTLETKLKHARNQIEVEMNKRRKVEKERNDCMKTVDLVRELLHEKNSSAFNEQDRERIAIFQQNSLPRQHSSKKSIISNDNDDSDLTPSDVSYDKTEEDVFHTKTYAPLTPGGPSAPPCSDEHEVVGGGGEGIPGDGGGGYDNNGYINKNHAYNNGNNGFNNHIGFSNNSNNQWSQKKREADRQLKRHRRSRSVDLVNAESGSSEVEAMGAVDDNKTSRRNRSSSSPFTSPFGRYNSQDCMTPVAWSGEMKRFNSGNSLTRPHLFVSTKHFKGDQCFVCHKKFKFGGSQQKCKDCKIWCHEVCRVMAPLPCMAAINTPKHSKDNPSVIGDFAPSEAPFVPAIVILCINEVECRGLGEQGLYRVSGNGKDIKELKERFQTRGKTIPNFNSISDIHVVCGFFKDFLRNLKEPILTHKLWAHFHTAAQKGDQSESHSDLIQGVSQLPLANRDTLAFIILHLQKVSEVKEVQMNVNNLSMVFAPTLVGQPHLSSPQASLPFETLLNHQRQIIMRLLEIPSDYWYSFIKVQDPSFLSSITPSNEGLTRKSSANAASTTPSSDTTLVRQPLTNVGWFNNANSDTPLTEMHGGKYMKKTSRFFAAPK